MATQEQLLRNALAEFACRVSPRPALHLIRARTAAADAPATTVPNTTRKDTES